MKTEMTDFNMFLLQAIDEALESLGKSVRQSIYFHIENKFNVARNEIPYNLQKFQGGLEKVFGKGATFIETLIMKNLQTKVGWLLSVEKSGQIGFMESLDAAKQSYLEKDTEQTIENESLVVAPFSVFTVSVSTP